MKKLLSILLIFAICFCFAACGEDGSTTKITDIKKNESNEDAETIIIKNPTFYNENDIKMTVKSAIKDSFGDVYFTISVENGSSKEILFMGDYFVVNGITLKGSFSAEAEAGATVEEELCFDGSDLELAKIEKILTVSDGNFFLRRKEGPGEVTEFISFTIETDVEDYTQKIEASGETLYSADGLELTYIGSEDGTNFEDEVTHKNIYMYAKNSTDKDLSLRLEVLTINGKEVKDFALWVTVLKNTSGFTNCEIWFEELDFEVDGDIEEIVFNLDVKDETDRIFSSDMLTVPNLKITL